LPPLSFPRLDRTDDGGKTIAKCSGCDLEPIGGPEAICFCGALPDKFRVSLRCVRNEQPTAEAPAAIVVVEATADVSKVGPAGVSYVNMEGSTRQFFRCDAYRATMSTTACATRWRQAQHATNYEAERLLKCRDCAIGASHAGERQVHRSKLFGAQICPRTRRWASRMISNRLGISSYNRAREVALGRNSKNTRPMLILEPRRLGVIVGYGSPEQRYVELRDDITLDTLELAVQTLRVANGRVAFCRPRGGPSISTADLARQMAPAPSMARGLISHAAKPRPRHRLTPIDRLPNEHRGEPRSNVSDGEGALARMVAS
jgi:hypothetical protein